MGTVGSAADTDEVNEEKDFVLPYFYSSLSFSGCKAPPLILADRLQLGARARARSSKQTIYRMLQLILIIIVPK
jgi:hypothetical protein